MDDDPDTPVEASQMTSSGARQNTNFQSITQ